MDKEKEEMTKRFTPEEVALAKSKLGVSVDSTGYVTPVIVGELPPIRPIPKAKLRYMQLEEMEVLLDQVRKIAEDMDFPSYMRKSQDAMFLLQIKLTAARGNVRLLQQYAEHEL